LFCFGGWLTEEEQENYSAPLGPAYQAGTGNPHMIIKVFFAVGLIKVLKGK
jgi:hypothetical protein